MTIIISKQENTNKKVNSAINVMKTYSISAERQKKFYKKHKRRGKMYKDIIINYGTELEKYSGADLVENDVDAYRIVYRTPWDLTGCTIKALCKRADGTVVSGTGFAEGKNAVFVIDSSMYAVPGELTVRLTVCTADEQVLTVCDVIANAVESFGDGIPGTNNKTILDQILINVSKINTALEGHKADESNPHAVTKEQVGLGNVDDVKQASKAEFDAHASAEVLDHPNGSVTTAKISDEAVTTLKLADGSVTSDKITDGTIDETKLNSELKTKLNFKADKGTTLADYGIGDAYTKSESDRKFELKEDISGKGAANGYAPLDANGKLPESYLYGVTVKQYGVRWKGTSSTVCERLGDAVGLVANAHKGSTDCVENDFDSIYPWSDMRLCNIDSDGNILAYAGEPSFMRDGTNGDVMVEIPKFYYKRVKTGAIEEIWICGTKLAGYELHPLFIDDGKEVSKVFHSAYNASSDTDETDSKVKLQSITGAQPMTRTARADFRTYARNKGSIWGIEDLSCVNALQILYLVEYANTDSQSALGDGASSLSYVANHKALEETTEGNTITIASAYKNVYKLGQRIEIGTSQSVNDKTTTPRTITEVSTDDQTGQTTITFDGDPITIAVGNMMWNVAPLNGSCDALNGKSGWLAGDNNYTDGYADVNYRGIEGFHAKIYRFIDGVNIKDRVVHYANSMSDYADGVYSGKYSAVGYTNAEANGYVSAFGYDEKAPWVMFPTAAAGGSSTYAPDYYYQSTGECQLWLGGGWSSRASAGAFFLRCDSGFSFSFLYYGAHLLVKKP